MTITSGTHYGLVAGHTAPVSDVTANECGLLESVYNLPYEYQQLPLDEEIWSVCKTIHDDRENGRKGIKSPIRGII